ncbi:hypothetical protein IKX12_00960 [Candidatus Saccharibacteria bacterium]|nr:hypothetical protein [Candidatus Saccharibacteria bacterium]
MKAKKRVAIKADDWCVRLKDEKFESHEMNLEVKLFIASAENGENLIIEGDDVVVEWVLETPFFDEEPSGLILDPEITNENHFTATLKKVISCGVFIFIATHKDKEVQLVLDGKTLYIC